jgi:hypothetical protein
MAVYDWNHDGKKDFTDDYIEYRIFQDSMKKSESYTPKSSGGISTFGAIAAIILGLVVLALFYSLLGIEVDDVPAIVDIILWIFNGTIFALYFDHIGL